MCHWLTLFTFLAQFPRPAGHLQRLPSGLRKQQPPGLSPWQTQWGPTTPVTRASRPQSPYLSVTVCLFAPASGHSEQDLRDARIPWGEKGRRLQEASSAGLSLGDATLTSREMTRPLSPSFRGRLWTLPSFLSAGTRSGGSRLGAWGVGEGGALRLARRKREKNLNKNKMTSATSSH